MEHAILPSIDFSAYLLPSRILDFETPAIQSLVDSRGWRSLSDQAKIEQIYGFVRDDIRFGYNVDDAIPASQVLQDGFGQCNTKANLFMALLRAVGIPNRMHGFTIHKALQKGAITGIWYILSPNEILHSWVEVFWEGEWYNLEGLILDKPYLMALQSKFADCRTTFCGYGVYTDQFQQPPIDWAQNHTYIQDKGIYRDFGLFPTPDAFYEKHQQKLSAVKRWIYRHYVRHLMNRNVARIRNGNRPSA